MQNHVNTNFLNEIELHVTRVITEDFSDKLVYHDIEHTHRVVSGVKSIAQKEKISGENFEHILVAAWFNPFGFKDLNKWKKIKVPSELFHQCSACSQKEAKTFLEKIEYPEASINKVLDILKDVNSDTKPQTLSGKVLSDAITLEWSGKKAKKRLNLLYQEFLLLDIFESGKKGYYEAIINFLKHHEFHTDYGKSELEPKKIDLIRKLEKDRKGINQREEQLLSKELNITEQEVKKLKKDLKKASGRDDRGIQTMFRTTSRNHYTLYQMVDRKANILISINAIILSLIIGRIIGEMETLCIHSAPIVVLMFSSLLSATFAVLSILPSKTHGEFSEEQVRTKQGNLLFFGNYHNMSFKDYNWGMLQMLNDSNYLYTSMIRDLYYFGQQLHKKYARIRIALIIFIIGIGLTVIAFLAVSTMPDFHFGGSHLG